MCLHAAVWNLCTLYGMYVQESTMHVLQSQGLQDDVCTLYKRKGQCLIQICTYVCNNTFRGLHNCANISQLLENYHINGSADSALHIIIV